MIGAIDNAYYLIQTFGKVPSFNGATVLNVEFARLEFVKISLLINERAKKMPPKWQDFNTIYFDLIVTGITGFNMNFSESQIDEEVSSISFHQEAGELRRVKIAGQVNVDCVFQFLRVQNFSPGMMRRAKA